MKIRKDKHSGRYLKEYHIKYLQLYAGELTQAQLAEVMGFSQAAISYWLKQLRLVAKKKIFQSPNVAIPPCTPDHVAIAMQKKNSIGKWQREVQRVLVYTPDPPKKIVRPPARYDNMSREDYINKYLNMD